MQLRLDEILKLVRINTFLYDILKFALNTRHHTLAKTEQAHIEPGVPHLLFSRQ